MVPPLTYGILDRTNVLFSGENPVVRILIADDHELFREGVRLVLKDLDPGLTVIQANSYDQALRLVQGEPPGPAASATAESPPGSVAVPLSAGSGRLFDLILVDLVMPGLAWTEGLRALKAAAPETPLVVLSANADKRLIVDAVKRGASGFIPKTSSSRVMISALKLVLSGGVYLPSDLLQDSGDEDGPGRLSAPGITGAGRGTTGDDGMAASRALERATLAAAAITPLTPRQREVLALLGKGKSNKEIARHLDLSEGTVKLHVTAILKALGVSNRTGAVIAAQRLGLTG